MESAIEDRLIEILDDLKYHLRRADDLVAEKNKIMSKYPGKHFKMGFIDITPPAQEKKDSKPLELVLSENGNEKAPD